MSNALAVAGAGRGLEEVRPDDLILPHVVLTQALSKFVSNDGLPVGTFVNTLTKKQYVGNSVTFVPFKVAKYVNLLKPQDGKMVFEARVTDETDARLEGRRFFNEKDERGNTLHANANSIIAVLAVVDGSPAIIKFAKTSYRAGKELLTMARLAGGDFWSHKYKLSSKKEIRGSNVYYIMTVEDAGVASEQEQAVAAEYYNSFAPKAVDVAGRSDDEVPF